MASSEAISQRYIDLHKECWGNPIDERFTRLPDAAIGQEDDDEPDAEDDDQPEKEDVVLPGDPFLRLASVKKNLLVRAEYIRMFDAVESSAHKRDRPLAVITGQPGIGRRNAIEIFHYNYYIYSGKRYWIYYALRRCLGRKQPVV
ncbi:MAG TPA: hypothetical protein VGO47_14345 [Chlamydiales bacterium]|nr:hypothetical protein [Chlamydiales bacterium]